MEKRYQVFVSSTFTDLKDERRAVMQALLELNCIPAGMELFPASTDDQWTLIQRVIDDCDYYLVIVGGRYGSMDAQGISYTEKEYDYAVQQGTPVMGFVHRQPDDTLFAVNPGDTGSGEAFGVSGAVSAKGRGRCTSCCRGNGIRLRVFADLEF